VPSPRFPNAEALVRHWHDERYGPGGWAHEGDHNLLREGAGPWKPERIDGIVAHPDARLEDWVWEATTAHVRYCVGTYGQWPVTYNPMQAGFGVIVHHVDADFYDRHYREGYVTDRIRTHFTEWH
jgi:hypothetical protein